MCVGLLTRFRLLFMLSAVQTRVLALSFSLLVLKHGLGHANTHKLAFAHTSLHPQVAGCGKDLSNHKEYHHRYRICEVRSIVGLLPLRR